MCIFVNFHIKIQISFAWDTGILQANACGFSARLKGCSTRLLAGMVLKDIGALVNRLT